MANSYQLVAWTNKGQVRMIPSEVTAILHAGMDAIDRMADKIRYNTHLESPDILALSRAYEKLGIRLLDLGRTDDAFLLFAQAAECCCTCGNNWEDFDDYEDLRPPLRGRFFAMYSQCKNLVRQYPRLRYTWSETSLTMCQKWLNEKREWTRSDYIASCGDPEEAKAYMKGLRFGRNEVYCHRRR